MSCPFSLSCGDHVGVKYFSQPPNECLVQSFSSKTCLDFPVSGVPQQNALSKRAKTAIALLPPERRAALCFAPRCALPLPCAALAPAAALVAIPDAFLTIGALSPCPLHNVPSVASSPLPHQCKPGAATSPDGAAQAGPPPHRPLWGGGETNQGPPKGSGRGASRALVPGSTGRGGGGGGGGACAPPWPPASLPSAAGGVLAAAAVAAAARRSRRRGVGARSAPRGRGPPRPRRHARRRARRSSRATAAGRHACGWGGSGGGVAPQPPPWTVAAEANAGTLAVPPARVCGNAGRRRGHGASAGRPHRAWRPRRVGACRARLS